MVRVLAASTIALLSCGKVERDDVGPDADTDVDTDVDTDGDTDVDTDVDAGIDAGIDAGCDPADCPRGLPTCLALHDLCPCAGSGLHELDLDGNGPEPPIVAYCDMELAGGGWTLVGRSMAGGAGAPFGWGVDRGSVEDQTRPYSLDVLSSGFAATELLVGSHDGGMAWGPNAYAIPIPPDFPSGYENAAVNVGAGVVVVAGECEPAFGAMWMLENVGHTSWSAGFFFRDLVALDQWGLLQGGWNLSEVTCERSGLLHATQGMLFAR